MKIFAPFKVQDIGGTSIFAKKFSEGMKARGHEVFFSEPTDYDVLFVIVHCSPKYLLQAKKHGKKIVHRLDGTYYWSVASWKYPIFNFPPAIIHRYFADATIYQSNYSRYCAEKFLGKPRAKLTATIFNGVDTKKFSPEGKHMEDLRDNPDQEIFFSASKFRRTDQILPLIESMKIYTEKYNANSKLVIAGSFSREVISIPEQFKHLPFLSFIGKVPNDLLPAYERSSDVFLFTHLNPPCPNNVIEAIACGLPICGVADGAMAELTSPGINSLLIPAEGDAFTNRRSYDTKRFAENMHLIIKEKERFSQASLKEAEKHFQLEDMIQSYIDICEKA